jgi:adenine-specific DNA-methyltransferase
MGNGLAMEKLKMHSPDLTKENVAKLAELFPNCVTEATDEHGNLKRTIDFDQLRQELSDHVVDGPRERYQLTWPGKREALLAANAPIAKTLRPCREESVDFDTTKNLLIEGDNLDALKLLQETYLRKIKLIYIDPPYNTGKDFLYNDNYSEDSSTFLCRSTQTDKAGNKLVINPETSGRFHSDWLSMIYPRIKLARTLLRDDGFIVISIDENELPNIRRVCDEIFGESNFIGAIAWKHTQQSKNDERHFSRHYNSLVVYGKSRLVPNFLFPRTEEDNKNYGNPDNDPKGDWRSGDVRSPHFRANLCFDITSPSGKIVPPPENGWRWSKSEVEKKIASGEIIFSTDECRIVRKIYLCNQEGRTPENLWSGEQYGTTRQANAEIKSLFDSIAVFDTPKPTALVRRILDLVRNETDFLVLDFFAGSGTTGHAVLDANATDGGTRQFILVQIAEECAAASAAGKLNYKTISEITKERVRRAGKKIKEETGLQGQSLDIGFRVLKVDTSNIKDVYYKPDAIKQEDLFDHIKNIKEDRLPEDLLFQVLLDWGVDLGLPIAQETIDGKTVFFVDSNALAACFDTGVTEELVKKIAARKPLRVVFRDAGFSDDSVKINVEQIFRLMSPDTEVKAI